MEIEAELNEALARVLVSGQFIHGAEVAAFEAEWAAYCGVVLAAGVACGSHRTYQDSQEARAGAAAILNFQNDGVIT